MSRYTRFSNRESYYHASLPEGLDEQPTDAERLFRYQMSRSLKREKRTSQAPKHSRLESRKGG